MATAVDGPDWARLPAALPGAPDTSSPVFPERPIRPLPKRRIRARISEDEANSIGRPLDPSSSPSVFSSPRTHREPAARQYQLGEVNTPNHSSLSYPSAPGAFESDDEREEDNVAGQRSSWLNEMMRYPRGSATSSVDGESFENTNNKKKRKIPLHHNSNHPIDPNDSDSAYGPAAAGSWPSDGAREGTSKPGSGAATAGRSRNVRSGAKSSKQPLGASVSGGNYPDGLDANTVAGAKDPRLHYPTGQENRRATPSAQPSNSSGQVNEFTFTAPSDSAKQLNQASRAGAIQPPLPASAQPRNATTHGTQTMPNGTAQRPLVPNPPPNPAAPQGQPEQPVDRPSKRELLHRQAAQRKRENRLSNRRKPPAREDVFLCDFCLYEAVFLERPRRLIRVYEEKELKHRQDQENRRRLLEKAKAKSRKTRKANRGQGKGAAAGNAAGGDATGAPYDANYDGVHDPQSPGDEYYDDDEFDDPAHDGEYDDGYDEYPPPLDAAVPSPVPGAYENPASPASPQH